MGQEPSEIRQQIVQTREEMSDTIDALGYKADVPARAKDKVTGTVDRARESVTGRVDSLKEAVTGSTGSLKGAAPDRGEVAQKAHRAVGAAQSNPMGLAIGSVAAGFLVGMLLPSTRVEDERIGSLADDVKAHASEVGQEAVEHGKQIAREVAQSAAETVGESATQHGEELRDTAQAHVDAVGGDQARPPAGPSDAPVQQTQDRYSNMEVDRGSQG